MSVNTDNFANCKTNVKESEEKFELKKNVGFWSGVALIIGTVVGSGIFVSPVGVLKSVNGSIGVCLLVWVGGGLIAMMSALCYCELGASLRASGGDVTNFRAAYGPAVSFVFTWSRVMINPGPTITLKVFGSYLLSPFYSDGCTPPDSTIKLIAILLLCFLIYLNCVSVKKTVKFEIAFSIIKFLAMALIAVSGIACLALGNKVGGTNFQNGFASGPVRTITAFDVGMAFYQGSWSYTGYRALYLISEEITNVKKNLPRATVVGLSVVIVMYILVNIGYLSVLTVDEIMTSKAVAVTFGKKVLGPMAFFIPLFVCFSVMGNQNGTYLIKARLPFAAARSRLMPRIFSMIYTK
ncbi:b(0,+)-type amino acid transporter 1-like isoform X1 [Clavelina lepadiformis]|uniref:b(0,+)-type amino acid transporter 1-like isoform X1 n=1 Tax=Clavelina lepadiformis TaxID=159417 RepID=UPI0040410702